ncbi:hypothetical protein JCM10212_004920 [Sporobolomyces blumeae]
MFGGTSTSPGGKWSLGAKTYRAPSTQERARELNDRYVRETERRKFEEIKHEEKRMRETRRLEREAARVNDRALGAELFARSPLVRGRSRSFGGVGTSPLLGGVGIGGSPLLPHRSPRIGAIGASHGLGGVAAIEHERNREMMERRRREAELASVRARRQALEVEAARRERSASSMAREREALALTNAQILSSPRIGSPFLGHHGHHGHVGVPRHHGGHLGVPLEAGSGLRRTRSFSSALPALGHSHVGGLHSHVPVSPRLGGIPYGGATPRLSPRGISPVRISAHAHHIARPPSPRVINNYNTTYQVSPRLDPVDSLVGGHHHHGHGGVPHYGDLGPYDDLRRSPYMDSLAYAGDPMHHGGVGGIDPIGGPVGGIGDFVITDMDYDERGRPILSELGMVEGASGASLVALSEDERLNLAIAALTRHAQERGANAVLSVETGEDIGGTGEIIVRGRAVILG